MPPNAVRISGENTPQPTANVVNISGEPWTPSSQSIENPLLPEGAVYRISDDWLKQFSIASWTPQPNDFDNAMANNPTREELDAKLAAAEARSETRFTELSGKIDRIADSVASLNATISNFSGSFRENFIDLREEMRHVRSDNKFTRISIIVAIVASVLAALGALWLTQANLLAAFQAGLSH